MKPSQGASPVLLLGITFDAKHMPLYLVDYRLTHFSVNEDPVVFRGPLFFLCDLLGTLGGQNEIDEI